MTLSIPPEKLGAGQPHSWGITGLWSGTSGVLWGWEVSGPLAVPGVDEAGRPGQVGRQNCPEQDGAYRH